MAKAATKIDKIAAQAAKPKIVRLKGKYSEIDLKATGKLPSWEDQDKLTAEQFRKRWRDARYFYYYHHVLLRRDLLSIVHYVFKKIAL